MFLEEEDIDSINVLIHSLLHNWQYKYQKISINTIRTFQVYLLAQTTYTYTAYPDVLIRDVES
jgi:PhoPQ-activated pathogenicity-related protein